RGRRAAAAGDPRRARRRRARRQRPRRRGRPRPAAGLEAPARAARSRSRPGAGRRTAAALSRRRAGAEADPRLGEDLRALLVGALRRARSRARGTQEKGGRRMTVMSSRKATVTLPTDEQIRVTREFDAPKHLVYKAWTTPELVKRWWNAKRGEVT